MYTPHKLSLGDIEKETFEGAVEDGSAPSLRLGTTVAGGHPVDLDPAGPAGGGSPAFGIVGDPGSGKTLALATIARRFTDAGGRATIVEKHGGVRAYLREAGGDADVAVLQPASGSGLRFPLCSAFTPGQDTAPDGINGTDDPDGRACLDALQADLIRDFLGSVCRQFTRSRNLNDAPLAEAAGSFVRDTPPQRRTAAGLLDVLWDRAADLWGSASTARLFDYLGDLRATTVARLVLDDDLAGVVRADEAYDSRAADAHPILILDVAGLPRWESRTSTPPMTNQNEMPQDEIQRAVLRVVAVWAFRLGNLGRLARAGSPDRAPDTPRHPTPQPALLGLEQAYSYYGSPDSPAPSFLLDRLWEARSQPSTGLSVGLTAEYWEDLAPLGGLLDRVFVGRNRLGSGAPRQRTPGFALDSLGVDPTDETIERLRGLRAGEFLYRDHRGRAGLVGVDPICRAEEAG